MPRRVTELDGTGGHDRDAVTTKSRHQQVVERRPQDASSGLGPESFSPERRETGRETLLKFSDLLGENLRTPRHAVLPGADPLAGSGVLGLAIANGLRDALRTALRRREKHRHSPSLSNVPAGTRRRPTSALGRQLPPAVIGTSLCSRLVSSGCYPLKLSADRRFSVSSAPSQPLIP